MNKDGTDDFTKVLNTSIGKDQKALILSPNPFTNQVEISQIDEAISSIKVQVLDRNQRAIRNGVFQNINGTIKIDRLVSNLSKGFYLVRLEGIGLNEVMPMIKL